MKIVIYNKVDQMFHEGNTVWVLFREIFKIFSTLLYFFISPIYLYMKMLMKILFSPLLVDGLYNLGRST